MKLARSMWHYRYMETPGTLDVVWRDEADRFCVVNKPAELPTQRFFGDDALHYDSVEARAARQLDGYSDLRLAHRLDKSTSGLLVIARTEKDAGAVVNALRRTARKRYRAVLRLATSNVRYQSCAILGAGYPNSNWGHDVRRRVGCHRSICGSLVAGDDDSSTRAGTATLKKSAVLRSYMCRRQPVFRKVPMPYPDDLFTSDDLVGDNDAPLPLQRVLKHGKLEHVELAAHLQTNRLYGAVDAGDRRLFGGRLATSTFTLERVCDRSAAALYIVELHSGRTHQIRIHASQAGMPIYGDRKYGGENELPMLDESAGDMPLHLQACSLQFVNPFHEAWYTQRRRVSLTLPIPDNWIAF
jgi:23S rRNA-/tRNA-specific pseudouridylate synthase